MELDIQGEYFAEVDDKHRVKLPAELVKSLGEFMVARYKDGSIIMTPETTINNLMEKLAENINKDLQTRNAIRLLLKSMYKGVLDANNRLYISPEFLKYASLKTGDKVCLKGCGDHAVLYAVRGENE